MNFFLVIYRHFSKPYSVIMQILIIVTAFNQAILTFHIALEQLLILYDEFARKSLTKNVKRLNNMKVTDSNIINDDIPT
jgi:hypothetical protein